MAGPFCPPGDPQDRVLPGSVPAPGPPLLLLPACKFSLLVLVTLGLFPSSCCWHLRLLARLCQCRTPEGDFRDPPEASFWRALPEGRHIHIPSWGSVMFGTLS